MQCTAFPAVIPIHIRNQMLAMGQPAYTWRGRQFEVVTTPDGRRRVFELDCFDPHPQPTPAPWPQPWPQPQPQPGPGPAPKPTPAPDHLNPLRIASFAALGIGGLMALYGFMTSYWHPIANALPGVFVAGLGAFGVVHTQKNATPTAA